MLMNMGMGINHNRIARGVDPHHTDVKPIQPSFQPRPFDNYANLQHQDSRLMGYNAEGNFTATNMGMFGQHQSFVQMQKDNSLINLVNGKRRGEF